MENLFSNAPQESVNATVPETVSKQNIEEAGDALKQTAASPSDGNVPKEEKKTKAVKSDQPDKEDKKKPVAVEKLPTDIFHQLKYIQQQLKVGKENVNRQINTVTMRDDSFPYRTLEEIYAELKPLLEKLDCVLTAQVTPTPVGEHLFATAVVVLENAKGERREISASSMMNLKCETYKYPAQESAACGTMAIKSAIGSMFLLDNTTKEKQADMVTQGMEGLTQPGHVTLPAPQKKTADAAAAVPAATPGTTKETPAVPSVQQQTAEAPHKPLLRKGMPLYNKLGIAARNFHGTSETLKKQLSQKYAVDEETLNAFVSDYYRGKVA